MTAVHDRAPLPAPASSSAPTALAAGPPKRERNSASETMLQELHAFPPGSALPPPSNTFQSLPTLPYGYSSHHPHHQPYSSHPLPAHVQAPSPHDVAHASVRSSQQQQHLPPPSQQQPSYQQQLQHSQQRQSHTHSQQLQNHQLQPPQQQQTLHHAHIPLQLNSSPDRGPLSFATSHPQQPNLHNSTALQAGQPQQQASMASSTHQHLRQSQASALAKTNSPHHFPLHALQPPSLPQLHHQLPVPSSTSHTHSGHGLHQLSHLQASQGGVGVVGAPHSTQNPSLQPLLQTHTQPNSVLLPALSHAHFKHTDEADVADDIINFSGRPHDMQAALASSAFSHDALPHGPAQSVMDVLLREQDPDPLNMNVGIHMQMPMDQQRSIERQVLVSTDVEAANRHSASHPQANMNHQTSSALHTTPQPFSLSVQQSMAHLPYGNHASGIPHPQVLLQGSSSVSPFQMSLPQRTATDPPSQLILDRNGGRRTSQQQSMMQLTQAEDAQRRALGANQISIQDLTKPKMESLESTSQDAQFSPASPSFSAVTVTPSALAQSSHPGSHVMNNPSANVTATGGESPTSVAAVQGLTCPECKSVFTRRYNLKVHMSSKHSERRDYRCNDCPNAFNRVDSLKRHVATTHRGEKKWECTHCQRTFGQRPHMKMHIDTVHLKKRDHKCHCGKAFGTRYNLTAHQRTHQQTPKKHVCGVCKKSFALKSSLARHQRNSAHNNLNIPPLPPVQG